MTARLDRVRPLVLDVPALRFQGRDRVLGVRAPGQEDVQVVPVPAQRPAPVLRQVAGDRHAQLVVLRAAGLEVADVAERHDDGFDGGGHGAAPVGSRLSGTVTVRPFFGDALVTHVAAALTPSDLRKEKRADPLTAISDSTDHGDSDIPGAPCDRLTRIALEPASPLVAVTAQAGEQP